MEKQTVGFSIDLNPFSAQLQGEIMADLTALRVVLKSIEDKTFEGMSAYAPGNKFIHWAINPMPDAEFLRAREIGKCLKAVVGSLQDFMDRLLAVIKLCEDTRKTPITVTEPTPVDALLSEHFFVVLKKISEDSSITVPKKIESLLADDAMAAVIQNYFDLRNGLEHHKGIAKKDRIATFKRISFIADSGKEIREILGPGILNAGEGLAVRIVDEQISFKEGDAIALDYSQMENIVLTIALHVIPALTQATMKKTNIV